MSYFPEAIIPDAGGYADEYFKEFEIAFSKVNRAELAAAGHLIADAVNRKRTIFTCGNGGSAAIANHLVCDCLKGIRNRSTVKPKVQSLSSNVELITAIANDFSVDDIFSFPLESLAQEGDVLISISSSGSSPNIVKAVKKAKDLGLKVIAMSGFEGGASRELADISLHVPCENYGVVEDIHQSLMHILAQYIRHTHLEDPSELGKIKF